MMWANVKTKINYFLTNSDIYVGALKMSRIERLTKLIFAIWPWKQSMEKGLDGECSSNLSCILHLKLLTISWFFDKQNKFLKYLIYRQRERKEIWLAKYFYKICCSRKKSKYWNLTVYLLNDNNVALHRCNKLQQLAWNLKKEISKQYSVYIFQI